MSRVNEFPVYHSLLSKERMRTAFSGRAMEEEILQKRVVRKFRFNKGV